MAQTEKCAHPNCTCPAEEGSKYCSTACEDSRNTTEVFCDCGHEGCHGSAQAGSQRIAS